MSEATQVEWFYTRHGERIGPVTFSEMQAKARELELNPRLDMMWKQGMAEWKAAGEIEGLFEKKNAAETQEALTPPAPGPEASQSENTVAETMAKETDWPGARRRSLILMTFLFPMVWGALFGFGRPFLEAQFGPVIMNYIAMAAAFIPLIAAVYFGLMRLVNLGMSRWWFLGHFVPLLNLWIGYRCFACPAGYAYHKKLDGAGVVLAIIYWLLLLLGVAGVVLSVMYAADAMPELQETLDKALRLAREAASKR